MKGFRKLLGKIPSGLLSVLVVAVILWLTLAPHPTGSLRIQLFPGADKVVHALMFGFLSVIVLLDIMKKKGWKTVSLPTIAIVAFGCALFGIGIELVQRAMGLGRTFEALDILADSFGAVAGAGIWAMIQKAIVNRDHQ